MKNKKQGFTLIELLIVIAIVGILSAMTIVALGNARAKSRDAKRVNDVRQIAMALELYFYNNGAYPEAITPGEAISDGTVTYISSVPSNPTPRNDSDCQNTNYTYSTQNNNTSYTIGFCLGNNISDVASGSNNMTPAGIIATNTAPSSICGDGAQDEGEECDDGDVDNNDYCLNTCILASCGDNYIWSNLSGYVEACDDGNGEDIPCTSACAVDTCGDGITQDGEECDDGNAVNEDACSNRCLNPRCGDEIIQEGEECDDGNDLNTDICGNTCLNN